MDGKSPYSEEKTEKMKKILAIGNSFSEDAARYLHQTAKAAGVDTKVVNLFIGGCPLERHWKNIERIKNGTENMVPFGLGYWLRQRKEKKK